MPPSTSPRRRTVIFMGRVQGVFFRATTMDLARGFAIAGWVRNESDGSVRCVVEGAPAELDRFVQAVLAAKRENVTHHEVIETDATGEFDGFSIR